MGNQSQPPLSAQAATFSAPQCGTVAQLSWAPTTQTTVVTTTKTTTTTFPPFLLNAPKHLADRDPERYPLAAQPTPLAIRKLTFDLGGRTAVFEEAANSTDAIHELDRYYATLRTNGGRLQTTTRSTKSLPLSKVPHETGHGNIDSTTIAADGAHSVHPSEGRGRNSKHTTKLLHHRKRPRLGPSPMNSSSCFEHDVSLISVPSVADVLDARAQDCAPLPPSQLPSRPYTSSPELPGKLLRRPTESTDRNNPHILAPRDATSNVTHGSATPPMAATDYEAMTVRTARRADCNRERISAVTSLLTTSPFQEGSLPSPSLSPITTSANLNHRSTTIPTTEPKHAAGGCEEDGTLPRNRQRVYHENVTSRRDIVGGNDFSRFQNAVTSAAFPLVSDMLDSFDGMPDALKSYMMYQFLRRCNKSTLLFLADVVNPALKCDFIARLPLELSWNVLQYLDHKEMCRAAQVSRKWRNILDSSEQAWARLLQADGYRVAPDEIATAVGKGWGWYLPHALDEASELGMDTDSDVACDADSSISADLLMERASEEIGNAERHDNQMLFDLDNFPYLAEMLKRKDLSDLAHQKRANRQRRTKNRSILTPSLDWRGEQRGPQSYARAATLAMAAPRIGLPSLRGHMHLFKSIYQKHHLIRHSWMDPTVQPLHLAFRGHPVHVVTCLQFDSEIILTGSDDSNIEIYSTRTGKSLMRLIGHDGGVWALEYHGNLLVSGSTDKSVRIWDMGTGKCLQVFQGHTSTVRCLQILHPVQVGLTLDGFPIMMPKEPLIITGSRDSTCRIWKLPKPHDRSIIQTAPPAVETENPYFVRTLAGHHGSVRAIAAHGDTLVSGSYDLTVRVWRISTGEVLHRLQGHSNKVYSVVLDHVRRRCISGSMDNYVKIWSLETGTCLYTLDGHSSLVGLLDLKDDYLVSAAADATLRVWEPETGHCKHVLAAHTGAITCFAHDGQKIISGSDQSLKMWNTQTGELVRDLLTNLSGVWQVKFDERRCVAAVHRNNWTYIEVLDFGAQFDGYKDTQRGRRIVIDSHGDETNDSADLTIASDL